MGSERRPSSSSMEMTALEEKVDTLSRALEQLLSRSVCAQCGACQRHAQQQEEQARRLEALEKLVLAMHTVLQGPVSAVPEKWRLPPGREGASKPGFQPAPVKELPNRTSSSLKVPLGLPTAERKEALFNLGNRNQSVTLRDTQPPKRGAPTDQTDEEGKTDIKGQRVYKTNRPPEREELRRSLPELAPSVQSPRVNVPKVQEGPARTESDRSGRRRKSLTQTKLGPREGKEAGDKQGDRNKTDSASQGEQRQAACAAAKETSGGVLTEPKASRKASLPNASLVTIPEPEKSKKPDELAEKSLLTVPKATDEGSTLRHVSSCPVSLQRLQSSEASPSQLAKAGNSAPGSVQRKHSAASSIQIEISPAPTAPPRPKAPPQTCCKVIDDDPPLPAPFPHRIVSLRPSQPAESFTIDTQSLLGGGRFGRVHMCSEKTSGLKLAAKIISARNAKEKETALNEIQVMNQLSHPNVIQLYDAYEARNEVVLIMEYVEGGELFERIVDESSPLTELDAMIYVKQICQGIQYMHQMYVLHLDLKPENILCLSCTGHQVKIIDFGLARRYKPREKLRVSFGTPEFLAPEIVNFDFVSFPTDMWTVGVVTYMLLSGLSPFLGDDDSQTLNNVLTINWYFDEEAFEHVSAEAKDFVSNLLIRERSGRLSATQCLKHPWLSNITEKAKHNNIVLKSQVQLKKYITRRLWKKNYIAIAAANRFKKISSSGSLTTLGI
ncbi:myosin light chain kinase 2, skeletal/cardiac muscle isoform X2 [Brienomyrus brachyistius]|uniref:myosin light chain kinase 2, skeletal/cardiac muscle isoform X2 n=1 Tax=Brienomyrus brachyistius TaxID=42636 RepID=UPI0020B3C48D|nr:myosin light chain kinase 2, skeletal/cardiac muscle isoform X2 [Brienomyrus brachyistius]